MRLIVLGVLAATLFGAGRAHASYTAVVNGGVLLITGNNSSDKLALRLAVGDTTTLEVDVKNNGTADFTFDRGTFTAISISAGRGNDEVLIDPSQGSFVDEALVIDGGAGRDTIVAGAGADTLFGGDGDDQIEGKAGADDIFLGAGDDVAVWNPGDGSDTIEGQEDDDTLEFNGSAAAEIFDLVANGGRINFFRNVGAIALDVNDVEQLDLATLGGVDTLTVGDLTGTDLLRVNVDLAGPPGSGDGQIDSVALNGTADADIVSVGVSKGVLEVDGLAAALRIANGEVANDRVSYSVLGPDKVHILGTGKADTVAVTVSPVAGVRATVDGFPLPIDVLDGGKLSVFGLSGSDTIAASGAINATGTVLELDGGPGNDDITGGDGADIIFGGSGNDRVRGGVGADLIQLDSGSDTATWGPGDGSDTVEGGPGTDTLDFRGSAGSEIFAVSPNAERARLTRNVGAIVMDLNDVEQIGIAALGAVDQITVNDMTGTDVKGVTVDLEGVLDAGTGDAQLDTVVVNGTAAADKMSISASSRGVSLTRKGGNVRIEHADLSDVLTVNGLAGDDKVSVAGSVSSAMTLTIDPD